MSFVSYFKKGSEKGFSSDKNESTCSKCTCVDLFSYIYIDATKY